MSNNLNVLSIDFNIIMHPCIRLYKDLSIEKESTSLIWNNIEYYRGVEDKFLQFDSKLYIKLIKLIYRSLNQDKSVALYKIDNHSQIVTTLEKYRSSDECMFDIVNIDFYHDFLNSKKDKNNIIRFNKYDSTNWVGYLFLKNMISNYKWIKASNSDLYDHSFDGDNSESIDNTFRSGSINLLDDLVLDNKFDIVFVNFPHHQVPYKYKYMYDLIFELFPSTKEE